MNKIRYCDICGVSSKDKMVYNYKKYGKTLCQKHYAQLKNHGKTFDTNQKTCDDMNDIIIKNEYAYIQLCDKYGNIQYEARIDKDDVVLVSKIKWRMSEKKGKIYVVGGSPSKHNVEYLTRYLLDYKGDLEIDHIDGESLHNEKSNLRIISRQNNINNLKYKKESKTKIRGVSFNKKNNLYAVDFSFNKNRFYFKNFKDIESAIYLRYLCETKYLKEFRYVSNDERIFTYINKLTKKEKRNIEIYFNERIKKYDY